MIFPDVYYYDFSRDNYKIDDIRELLGTSRYVYCAEKKSEKAGLCSAYAFLLLRYALIKRNGIKAVPEFEYGEYGKPFLKSYPDIHFSMSHAGTTVICAVSEFPVGVDIQDIRKISINAAKRFLTDSELSYISGIRNEETIISELCRIWCIKESYGKYTGKGFAEGFSSFEADQLIRTGKVRTTMINGFFISVCCAHKEAPVNE
ncbi:MAG: 4'-phosphopantetheinyl transferase superfamily protein [Ruminiclostridium sp.]|nr:4'-phosphopantetheinyl transferase superfamily protein [Ruminiclostridium sp.]